MGRLMQTDAVAILTRHAEEVNAYFALLRGRYPQRRRASWIRSNTASAAGKAVAAGLNTRMLHCLFRRELDPAKPALWPRRGPWNSFIPSASFTTICRPWTMTIFVADSRPTTKYLAKRWPSLPAMPWSRWRLRSSRSMPTRRHFPGLIRELAGASGPQGMIGGQVLDIDGENQRLSLPELQRIHRMKTGALLTASCRIGAIAARNDDLLPAMTEFGRHLGWRFKLWTMCWMSPARPNRWARRRARTPAKEKIHIRAYWV